MERPARLPPTLPRDLHVLHVSEDEAQTIRERLATSDEYELVADRPISRPSRDNDRYEDDPRRSRREQRRRRRSRSRMISVDDLENGKSEVAPRNPDRDPLYVNSRFPDYIKAQRIQPHVQAPTPLPAENRRAARYSIASRPQGEDVEVRHTRQNDDSDLDGHPIRVSGRTRSRSKSKSGARWNAPFGGRPPTASWETVDVQERTKGAVAAEDYDWYDSHGQRVRVREI